MKAKKSSVGRCLIASAIFSGVLLSGCNGQDSSKPSLTDVKTALQERYGECSLWTLSDIQRLDGAPHTNGYEVSYSFVLTLKNPSMLTGHGVNVTEEERHHVTAAAIDSSEPCFYGVIPLASTISQEQGPLAHDYKGTGDRMFVRSEQGWHLNTSPPDGQDPSTYDDFAPVDDATAAASQAGTGLGQSATSEQSGSAPSIFHRLNLLVMSLFRGGRSNSSELASVEGPASTAAPDSAASEQVPTASPAEVASDVTGADSAPVAVSDPGAPPIAASAETPEVASQAAPVAATSSPPVAVASTAPPSPDHADANQAINQITNLQPLLRKAHDQVRGGQYGSAVATAEAVLLLDPANTQAQQIRAAALRLEQESAAKVSPPPVTTAVPTPTTTSTLAPTIQPPPEPVSRTLAMVDLDGDWRGVYQCGAYSGSVSAPDPDAWTHHIKLTVRNGQARLVRESHGEHAYREVLAGTVAPDLTLQLSGTGQYADAQHAWTTAFTGRFTGTPDQPGFQANGALTNWRGEKTRTCQLALSR